MALVIYVFVHVCLCKSVCVSIEIEEWEVVWLPLIPLSNFCGLRTPFSSFHKYKGMMKQWNL